MQAFLDRSASIEAMWVVNAEGRLLYSSVLRSDQTPADDAVLEKLRRGETIVNSKRQGKARLLRCLGAACKCRPGVRSPGGLRLLLNPADWTGLASGLWRQFILLFALGGGVALLSAFLTTALYTRRFRLISDTLRQAETGTYAARPQYAGHDEVGASLDLDRSPGHEAAQKRRRARAGAASGDRRAHAGARSENAAECFGDSSWKCCATKLRAEEDADAQSERSLSALDSSVRQVDRLVRDFTDYSAPVTMERKPIDVAEVLHTSLEAVGSTCVAKKINLIQRSRARPLADSRRCRAADDRASIICCATPWKLSPTAARFMSAPSQER